MKIIVAGDGKVDVYKRQTITTSSILQINIRSLARRKKLPQKTSQ